MIVSHQIQRCSWSNWAEDLTQTFQHEIIEISESPGFMFVNNIIYSICSIDKWHWHKIMVFLGVKPKFLVHKFTWSSTDPSKIFKSLRNLKLLSYETVWTVHKNYMNWLHLSRTLQFLVPSYSFHHRLFFFSLFLILVNLMLNWNARKLQ